MRVSSPRRQAECLRRQWSEDPGLGYSLASMTTPDLQPLARLTLLLDALARFSASSLRGVTRLTYDAHWCEAHAWIRAQAHALGLDATSDAAGNLYLHAARVRAGDEALLVGSHLDTVVNGGRYDGAYGVIAGLVLAAAHRDMPGTPVVGFVTCEEEGSRFGGDMMGARSLLGTVEPNELETIVDAAGVTWRQALAEAAARGCAAPLGASRPFAPYFKIRGTLELHIEQGPILEQAAQTLGIVEAIAGYRRQSVHVSGAPRHAGTTPAQARQDALAGAAEMILAAETVMLEWGDPARVTCGRITASPGAFNVIPGAVELALELRHQSHDQLDALDAEVAARFAAVAARRRLGFERTSLGEQLPTAMDARFVAAARALAKEQGIAHRVMTSGAGHDSMVFARAGIPALMLFVPSRDGISHSPQEFTDAAQLQAGVAFASALLTRLAVGEPA